MNESPAFRVAPPPCRSRSLAPLRSGGTATPLFCIHGMGGHVAAFIPLARGLTEGRPVYGLLAQGLEPGQRPHDRIEDMAEFYLGEMREVQTREPFLLAGWSMGGTIALEMAHRLQAAGQRVALVAMLDTHISLAEYEKLDLGDKSVIRWIAPHLKLSAAELKKLPLERQWERIAQQANLSDALGAAEIRRLAEACKAHLAAAVRYRPRPYDGPVVLFQAEMGRGGLDRRWKQFCPTLHVEPVPGNHYSMLQKPAVDVLAERLDRYIGGCADITRNHNVTRLAAAGTAAHGRAGADVPSAAKRAGEHTCD